GAQFLVRSSARRCPTCCRHLPDGSYLARLGYGVLPALMTVRVIEAAVTITLADGTARREQWRLITTLLHPAPPPPPHPPPPATPPANWWPSTTSAGRPRPPTTRSRPQSSTAGSCAPAP